MLLGKKTKSEVVAEWAVILDRLENDFSRNRAIDKLAEVFSLSVDEAKDIIDSTPIILLDHLSLELAEKVKDHFSQSGVQCSLTNDTFAKRKCFRAVWPEQPSLSHLVEESSSELNGDFEESSSSVIESTLPSEPVAPEFIPQGDLSGVGTEEENQLKQLALDLQKENEMLRLQLEKAEGSVRERERKRFGLEIDKLQTERLRNEEAISALRSENKALVSRVEELERDRKTLIDSRAEIEQLKHQLIQAQEDVVARSQFTELRTQLDHFRSEYTRAQNAIRLAQSEVKQYQSEWTQARKALSDAQTEAEDLKRMLGQAQVDAIQLKDEAERIRREVDSRVQTQSAELEEWKRKANDWSTSYFKVIKENEFLRSHQSEELESLKERNQQLNTQLEQAQKQVRDFTSQLEQQEVIQKRTKITTQLAEQEAQLKAMVQKQQTLEAEIRLREEEMKVVLSEQQVVEQEIVKTKQAQKYLIEQAKIKEKNRFSRQKGPGQGSSFIAPPLE